MELLVLCLVFFTINSITLFVLLENRIVELLPKQVLGIYKHAAVMKPEDHNLLPNNTFKLAQEHTERKREEKRILKARNEQDLHLEKVKLNNQLKMLEFMSDFELYLHQNKISASRMPHCIEFNDLKIITQENVLKSTRKISQMVGK
ncbi:hypothetical protein ACFO5O_13825 [Geojedonia litorea]|uniref:Uncharacterized protein n=1 Tax=Geojedonia litorea TaxID=1268269 RepID=A0ABV9N7Z4_9FLAO